MRGKILSALTVPAAIASLLAGSAAGAGVAAAATVVALGASQTYGKGVARGEDYPSQLQAMLRAQGYSVRFANAGVNGDTTTGMRARLAGALTSDTVLVILQPGGNDRRKGVSEAETSANIAAIKATLAARNIPVVMVPNQMFAHFPRQADGQHLTAEGYRGLAAQLVSQVAPYLKK